MSLKIGLKCKIRIHFFDVIEEGVSLSIVLEVFIVGFVEISTISNSLSISKYIIL